MRKFNWLNTIYTIVVILCTTVCQDVSCIEEKRAAPAADTFSNDPVATLSSYSNSKRKGVDSEERSGDLRVNALNYNGEGDNDNKYHKDDTRVLGSTYKTKPPILSGFKSNDLSSLSLVANDPSRQDICKDHCECPAKYAFLVVECDFKANHKLSESFGEQFHIPPATISITIRLARKTKLRLRNGFFNNNTVNSLSIIGNAAADEQVEIESNAFEGNYGPQLEMSFQNISVIFVRENAFAGDGKIQIRHSNMVKFFENAFKGARVHGIFMGIDDFRIEEKAFNSAQTKLRIDSSHIPDLYRFEASLHEIQFNNCSLGTINTGTFDVNNINSIIFDGCTIETIKMRAITEKLYSKHVSITHAKIGYIESEAIFGSGITTLILTDNTIDTIQSNAIHVTAINATISRNNIKHLERDWFRVDEWSYIIVQENNFGKFGRILIGPTKRPMNCVFESNSITEPEPGSLNITHPKCMLREIAINRICRCNTEWLDELSSHDLRSEIYCNLDTTLAKCFNVTSLNVLKYLNEVCDEQKTILNCNANVNLKRVKGKFYSESELKSAPSTNIVWIIGYSLLGFIVCFIFVLAGICLTRKFCLKKLSINKHIHEFSDNDHRIIGDANKLVLDMYPTAYPQFLKLTRKLTKKNLSDNECEYIITRLEEVLPGNSNESEAISIFHNMLLRHMEASLGSAPACDADFYATSTIVYHTEEDNYGNLPSALPSAVSEIPEHIYAEPNCARQQLLPNEYASPADRNVDNDATYSEPVNGREMTITSQQTPEYAIPQRTTNIGTVNDLPSTLSNMPDVLRNNINQQLVSGDDQLSPHAQILPQSYSSQLSSLAPANDAFQLPYQAHNSRLPTYSFITTPKSQRNNAPYLADRQSAEGGAIANDVSSDHSGGSDETVEIEDIIDYADA